MAAGTPAYGALLLAFSATLAMAMTIHQTSSSMRTGLVSADPAPT